MLLPSVVVSCAVIVGSVPATLNTVKAPQSKPPGVSSQVQTIGPTGPKVNGSGLAIVIVAPESEQVPIRLIVSPIFKGSLEAPAKVITGSRLSSTIASSEALSPSTVVIRTLITRFSPLVLKTVKSPQLNVPGVLLQEQFTGPAGLKATGSGLTIVIIAPSVEQLPTRFIVLPTSSRSLKSPVRLTDGVIIEGKLKVEFCKVK